VGSENDDKMGPKKKNKVHNDFYYFMMDKQKEIETELGKKITDLKQLGQLCSPRWSELDDHAKKKYKDMAKADKKRRQDLNQVYTTDGKSLAMVEREMAEQQRQHADMVKDIRQIVNNLHCMMKLKDSSFFIIHMLSLVEVSGGQHLPCEIGVVEFSLKKGVFKTFHSFVKPPSIPLGYAYNISKNVADKHGLDPDQEPLATDPAAANPAGLIERLEEFINPLSQPVLPPLYTISEEAESVEQMMATLYECLELKGLLMA